MAESTTAVYRSPIGELGISGGEAGITSVWFIDESTAEEKDTQAIRLPHGTDGTVIRECIAQLDEYFSGDRKEFTLKLDLHGTDFQKRVWRQLQRIPFGVTVSYREIAAAIGNREAVRAVGAANGQNPISIVVPCHRVIGSDKSLTGYGGGLWRKRWLLAMEGRATQTALFPPGLEANASRR